MSSASTIAKKNQEKQVLAELSKGFKNANINDDEMDIIYKDDLEARLVLISLANKGLDSKLVNDCISNLGIAKGDDIPFDDIIERLIAAIPANIAISPEIFGLLDFFGKYFGLVDEDEDEDEDINSSDAAASDAAASDTAASDAAASDTAASDAAASDAAASSHQSCDKCSQKTVTFVSKKKRATDEPSTIEYTCNNSSCGNKWIEV